VFGKGRTARILFINVTHFTQCLKELSIWDICCKFEILKPHFSTQVFENYIFQVRYVLLRYDNQLVILVSSEYCCLNRAAVHYGINETLQMVH
jgi:hypothetical protein